MKICRFDDNRLGLVEHTDAGYVLRDVTAALDCLGPYGYPLPQFDPLVANLDAAVARIKQLAPNAPVLPLAGRQLLAPIASPGKIVAAPVNYKKHLDEAREQAEIHHNNQVAEIQKIGLFLKATSSLVGASQGVALQHAKRRNDHEAELVVVIGKAGRNIARADAFQHIAGYSSGLDMTTRGPEERSLRKSVDTYSVLGPWFVTADEIPKPGNMAFSLTVNGQIKQQANTCDLILSIGELIEFASSFYTLHPGDLIYTGTPEGVGPVVAGDTIVTEFAGIGRMEVAVRMAVGAPV
jgi:2,4-didehydro-3-deoxy-L-rhamnonate hydrolase